MKKFFSAIGKFFKENYWIEPLLLVAIVFALVFSISGFQNVIDTVKGWLSSDATCKVCERVKVTEAREEIASVEDGEYVYVFYYNKTKKSPETLTANGALNLFVKNYNKDLKAAGKETIEVYAVNYGVKEVYEYGAHADEPEEYYDKKMTDEVYKLISEEVKDYLLEVKPTDVTGSEYTISVPILVRYEKVNGSVEVSSILYSATPDDVFNQTTLKEFFDGTYDIMAN